MIRKNFTPTPVCFSVARPPSLGAAVASLVAIRKNKRRRRRIVSKGSSMSNELNRRDALRRVGLTAGALLTGNAVARVAAASENAAVAAPVVWKYAVVDPKKVADTAYAEYEVGRCMFATFRGIVFNVAEALAKTDPAAADALFRFPYHIMRYGDSGANGRGSLCGSVNGAMAAISLFAVESKTRAALCDEIANYYERTLLPIYRPAGAESPEPFPQTIANSVLCHVSSGKWAALAQVRVDAPERTERCSRLSADVAKKTAELLNLNVAALASKDVAPIVELRLTEPTATCVACHDKKGTNADAIGKTSCDECHPDKTVDHDQKK